MNVGERFGRLVVLSNSASRPKYVCCRCDCGNVVEVRASSLTKKNPTSSCGCIQKEVASKIGSKTIDANMARRIETNMKYHTNFQVIENETPPKNNRSGHKGVWWDEPRQLWAAYLNVHRKRIFLGRFSKYEDAVKARQRGEEEYFLPLIEQKAKDVKEKNE